MSQFGPATVMRRLGYRKELDGIRGFAVAIVVIYHAYEWPHGGVLSVDIFFVLSGFLITTLLLQEDAARGQISLPKFYARRALRLLPAVIVLLGCYLVYATVRLAVDGDLRAHAVHELVLAVTAGLFYFTNFLEAFHSSPDVSLGHLWSLSEEEQFYWLWPLALLLLRRRPRVAVGLLSFLVLVIAVHRWQLGAAGATVGRLSYAPDTRSDGLVVGCIAAILYTRRDAWSKRLHAPRRLLAVAPLALLLPCVIPGRLLGIVYYEYGIETLFVIGCAVALVAALAVSPRWLIVKPLVYLGSISYPLYLWHMPLIFALHASSRAGHRNGVLLPTVAVLASLAAAVASTHLVERPFLRLKTRLGAAPAPVPAQRAEPEPAAVPVALATAD